MSCKLTVKWNLRVWKRFGTLQATMAITILEQQNWSWRWYDVKFQ